MTASSLPKRGFIYFETEPFTLPPNTLGGSTGKCPRRWKAINGYFASNTRRVVPIENYVGGSPRKWTIVTVNEGLSNAQVYVGIVCGRIRR